MGRESEGAYLAEDGRVKSFVEATMSRPGEVEVGAELSRVALGSRLCWVIRLEQARPKGKSGLALLPGLQQFCCSVTVLQLSSVAAGRHGRDRAGAKKLTPDLKNSREGTMTEYG